MVTFSLLPSVVDTANVGGYKIIFCDSELEVSSALQVIEKRRRARGYKLTE